MTGTQPFADAALDLAGKDARADRVAEIGIEQQLRHLRRGAQLDHRGQRRQQSVDRLDLGVGKAPGASLVQVAA